MATTTIKDIVQQHLDNVKAGIAQRMAQQGRNASGRSVASLNVVATDDGGSLEGSSSFLAMENGRGPGKVPYDFVSIIRDWIVAKGISYQDMIPKNGTPEQGLKRLSGAIAYSIIKNGTKLYRDNGYNDIFTSVLEEEMEKMSNEIAGVYDLAVDALHNDNKDNEIK